MREGHFSSRKALRILAMPTGDPTVPNLDAAPAPARVRFGSFEFDTATGELRRDGIQVRLQAQPAKVLAHLVLHAGETVSRDDLHNTIWGDDTFVNFERGLNVCIAQIRSALADESTSPRFIRTLPRRGYQFICPVERIQAETPAAEPEDRVESPKPPRRVLIVSALALALIALLAAIFWRQFLPASSPSVTVAIAPFDNETGDPALNSFCRSLTENVVQQLTASGKDHYRVIGNAAELWVPREQRDLVQGAARLGAQYVVLGQVQGGGNQVRILAHLIHMPEQTHVWVVRLEQPFDDPFALESSAARDIAVEFSHKLQDPTLPTNLHSAPNN